MQKIALAVMAVIAIMSSIGSAVWPFPNFGITDSGNPEPISIGVPPNEASTLILIAEDQGFFTENGLNATIKDYDAALAAINGMKNNEVDISVSAEYPIITEVFKKENISIIGCIDKHQTAYVIGRRDRGIENVSDLKGKRIGIPRGTIGDFYVGRFLNLHGINLQDVTIVDVQQSQSWDTITNGSVDAILIRETYDNQVGELSGSNFVVWPAQNSQATYMVMACRNDWATTHPELISRLLKSLNKAEIYLINYPDETRAIVQKRLHYDGAFMETIWPNNQFLLSLDQSLISAMEDEARWMIKNNLTTEKKVPNFQDYIYEDGLKAIKPESVNIIR